MIELEPFGDERGFLARVFCAAEFYRTGLVDRFSQINISLTARAFTLRGLHYQLPPSAEVKIVCCIRGALFDVIVDLRPDSPSFRSWFGIELSAASRTMLYVPRGCAHGFVTLVPDVEAFYIVSDEYAPERERGLRFDDAWVSIGWPVDPTQISAKDRSWPDFDPVFHGIEQLRGLLARPAMDQL